MRKIIINADDFGLDFDRDLGIFFLGSYKCISSISVMVTYKENYKRIKKMINIIKKKNPQISIGLHLNLTDYNLLTCKLKDICRVDNTVHNSKIHFWRAATINEIDLTRIDCEIKEQIEQFYLLFNFYPDHIDGHNHCHISNNDIYNLVIKYTKEYNISNIRFPNEDLLKDKLDFISNNLLNNSPTSLNDLELLERTSPDKFVDGMTTFPVNDIYLYRTCCKQIDNAIIKNEFLGTLYGHVRKFEFLKKDILNKESAMTYEFMVHPGFYFFKFCNHFTQFSNWERFVELINVIRLKLIIKRDKKTILCNQEGFEI